MLLELNQLRRTTPSVLPGGASPEDQLRRTYLTALSEHTGRDTISYATSWLESRASGLSGDALSITLGDVQAFMEVCSNLHGRELDLILTTPGGSPEAAESIVEYLRSRFDHIRVIVPVAAMSAGTMISLAADQIVLGAHSQLGPIDPQITISTPEGPRSSPAQAIFDQFDLAKTQIAADPNSIGAWMPLLRGLMPGLLAYCEAAREFSANYARRVLEAHAFAGFPDAAARADEVAAYFGNFTEFKSHGRRVSRDDARQAGLPNIFNLEDDKTLQDLVLSVHHAARFTFGLGVHKLAENQLGRTYMEQTQQVQIAVNPAGPGVPTFTPAIAPPAAPPLRQIRPGGGKKPKRSR